MITEHDLFTFSALNQPRQLVHKRDLRPINNLKLVFRKIRDYLAGNLTGITRDESIARQMMFLLFCKIHDEQSKSPEALVDFSLRPNEDASDVEKRIKKLFEQVHATFGFIFEANEKIEISGLHLEHVVSELEAFALLDADRDVIGDAFEELIGTAFRGGEGQFFTPRNVVQMMINVLQPTGGERIIDPACGSGGFLAHVARYLLHTSAENASIVGIEKDLFLSRLARIYLSLLGPKNFHVFCENSLEKPHKWKAETQSQARLESFDVILTNPPFGAKIPVVGEELLQQYELGYDWQEKNDNWEKTKSLLDKQPPQILFIERCLQLLKNGGRAGIILPEGIFGNPSERYIWEFLQKNASVLGIVSLSQETFQPSTHTKTSVLFLEKTKSPTKQIFMAIANAIGHDKNGKEVYRFKPNGLPVTDENGNRVLDDDLPEITENFRTHLNGGLHKNSHLGFTIKRKAVVRNVFIPEYYNPEIQAELDALEQSGKHKLVTIGELLKEKIIEIKRGNEIGSRFYGSGMIPFVRTTDIVNWEIKFDPVKAVSEKVYEKYQKAQDVKEGDILFVSDGTFLIGKTAFVSRLDEKIVIQSHLKKIRVVKCELLNPYYFFYLLNSKIVRRQIEAKTFVQATISTLGNRLLEVVLPVSLDKDAVLQITTEVQEIIEQKTELRERCMRLIENSI